MHGRGRKVTSLNIRNGIHVIGNRHNGKVYYDNN